MLLLLLLLCVCFIYVDKRTLTYINIHITHMHTLLSILVSFNL